MQRAKDTAVSVITVTTQHITRQSEMANTSPRHMPVLGNVHPIKIMTMLE